MQEQDRRRGHGQLEAVFVAFVLDLQSLLLGRDVYFQGRDSIHVLLEQQGKPFCHATVGSVCSGS